MQKKPNIVHLISHDMGRYLGCYGRRVATPNYDRIAGLGIRFSNYFCTAASCSPSRGSISTGLYPHNNGLIGLGHIGWRVRRDVKMMPDYLNELGYETCLIGGHHEPRELDGPAADKGTLEGRTAIAKGLGYKHFIDTADLTPIPKYNYIGACYEKLEQHIDGFIEKDAPFFINIGTPGAHRAYTDNRYGILFDPDDPDRVEIPPYMPDRRGIRQDLAYLHGFVKREDEYVGKIFELLEEKGLLDNTLFVLTTDHGIAMPRAKGMCYDPGLGTFLIMYMKGRFEGGQVYDELLSNVDLLPTYVALAGGEPPADIDGRSFLPLMDGRDYEKRADIFAELTYHDEYNPMRSVRTERHKYVRNFGRRPRVYLPLDVYSGAAGSETMKDCYYYTRAAEELYDLAVDPWEQRNLAADPAHEEPLLALRGRVQEWMERTDDPLLKGDVPPTEEQRHRQETTGYYNG